MESPNTDSSPEDKIYGLLQNQVIQLHLRWAILKQLFFTTEDQISLLNWASGNFFAQLYFLLEDEIILSISRLTDPLQPSPTRNQDIENLVLQQLVKDLNLGEHDHLLAKLNDAKEASKTILKRRNKLIAHSDKYTYLTPGSRELIGVSFDSIENALQKIRDFMNLFELQYRTGETYYEGIDPISIEKLIIQLRKAFDYDVCINEGLIPRGRLRTSQMGQPTGEISLYVPGYPAKNDDNE
jgi:hypothetical protein